MGVYVFGAGSVLYRVLDANGIYQARRLPTLKEAAVKFDGKLESQFGSAVYAEDAASGERKITGTLKWGRVAVAQINEIVFGGTVTAGHPVVIIDEGGVVGIAPTANVATIANLDGTATDMGVISAVDGNPMTRVSGSPAANGQYQFDGAAGTYTFFAADPRAAFVRLSYRYNPTAATGKTMELGNPLQGTLADMEITLWKPRFTKNLGIILYHAVMNGLDLSSKGGAYTDPSATFEAFVDQAKGSPGQIFSSEED